MPVGSSAGDGGLGRHSRSHILRERGPCVCERVGVDDEVKGRRANRRRLAEHDVLGNALHVVCFAVHGGIHEHLDHFLEGALHERPAVDAVDAVPRDGHQEPLLAHGVAEQRQVAEVDVRTVKRNDRS